MFDDDIIQRNLPVAGHCHFALTPDCQNGRTMYIH